MATRDGASSPLIGFLAAGALFMLMMAFTLHFVSTSKPAEADIQDEVEAASEEALQIAIEEPGFTSSGANEWEDDPDALERFGLADPDRRSVLDWDKLQELREGKLQADDTNDAPDYPEVQEALGLDDGTNFHLRTRPLFIQLDSSNWDANNDLEVAYVAHGTSSASNAGSISGQDATATDAAATWEVTVENTGSEAMSYKVRFELETADVDGEVVVDQYTEKISPGATDTVSYTVYETDGWDGDLGHVNATVYDAWSNEHDTVDFSGTDLPSVSGGGGDEWNFEVYAGQFSYSSDETPTLYLDHYDHAGERADNAGGAPTVQLEILDAAGDVVTNTTVDLKHNKATTYDCEGCPDDDHGQFTAAVMTSDDQTRLVEDTFRHASGDEFQESKTPTGDAQYEMGLVEDMMANFDNTTHEGDTHGDGDVYVDDKDVLFDHLKEHLSSYDTLVVGSNVEHNEMTAGDVKWPIHDWVTEEGGHLIVLGNDDPNTQWLQPLYGSGSTTASGGVSTPDPTHPILHDPEELHYKKYLDHGTAWKLSKDAGDYYTHVIQKDSSGSQSTDTLAVSEPGAFGNGSVVLGSYNLSDLTDPQDEDESKKFLRNMILESYQMVYVDYGPELPANAVIASEKRAAAIPHESLPGGVVEVKVILYVWK